MDDEAVADDDKEATTPVIDNSEAPANQIAQDDRLARVADPVT